MTTTVEDKAYMAEVMGKEYALNVPCVVLYLDGEEVKLWSGSFGQSKDFETSMSRGKVLVLKFAVGASEVDYWIRKLPIIKAQWQRDSKWREWARASLRTLRTQWLAE